MNDRRAQDLLRHIMQDQDHGESMMRHLDVEESVAVMNQLLPACMKEAEAQDRINDTGFFTDVKKRLAPAALENLKQAEHLWMVYDSATGYPYMVEQDLLVLYDYTHHQDVEDRLSAAGYQVVLTALKPDDFRHEVGHMYRNGYQNVRFLNGISEAYVVAREDLYDYENLLAKDYMANPALSGAMIRYFQEFRSNQPEEGRQEDLQQLYRQMLDRMKTAEFMVPCIKTEEKDAVEISHPYIDVTERVSDRKDGEKIIAVPAFTDGFEMDKCYEGHHENMLYQFPQLVGLTEELGASGVIFDALGISFFLYSDQLRKILDR